jgi:hypothetical protein
MSDEARFEKWFDEYIADVGFGQSYTMMKAAFLAGANKDTIPNTELLNQSNKITCPDCKALIEVLVKYVKHAI